MTSYPLSAPTAPRHRRSYTSIPQYDGSKDASDTPKEHKKHRSRHSLHHHLPHPYRRLKESQPPSSTALLGSNPFKQLTEKHENATAAIDDSKPQSGVVAVDGTSEAVAARELVQRQDIERERQRTEIRNNELRNTLHSLSELSMSTTRKLDDIYYSILEKVSTLQNTIGSLQELSSLTKQLRHDFDDQSEGFKEDMQEQINGFGGFNIQKDRIDGLESRVKKSREEADRLSERLRTAQERIQVLEVREGEWQATVNRRFTIFWTTLGTIVALVIALTIFNLTSSAGGLSAMDAARINSSDIIESDGIPLSVQAALESEKQALSTSRPRVTSTALVLEEDPRLRIFDEL